MSPHPHSDPRHLADVGRELRRFTAQHERDRLDLMLRASDLYRMGDALANLAALAYRRGEHLADLAGEESLVIGRLRRDAQHYEHDAEPLRRQRRLAAIQPGRREDA